jgi:glutathione S-transferase
MMLYNFAWGMYARRITLYLAAKDISDIELVEVELPHQPELWPEDFLLKLNPGRFLPVLDTGTMKICQSIVILEYLEERYPTPNMLGKTSEERAETREFVVLFEEVATHFGVWARQGSRANAGLFPANLEAARIGAERFAGKLQLIEEKFVGPYLTGHSLTIGDIMGLALIEFMEQFYGVPVPADCPKLAEWYARLTKMELAPPPIYPPEMHSLALGLPEQTQIFL